MTPNENEARELLANNYPAGMTKLISSGDYDDRRAMREALSAIKEALSLRDSEKKRADEAEAELARVREASQWRPIETAPRDGTEIIGYRPDQGVFVFRWAWMEEFVPRDQNGDPTEEYDDGFSCWWHDRWNWMEGELTPTHWLPLPTPPERA